MRERFFPPWERYRETPSLFASVAEEFTGNSSQNSHGAQASLKVESFRTAVVSLYETALILIGILPQERSLFALCHFSTPCGEFYIVGNKKHAGCKTKIIIAPFSFLFFFSF